jgi:hypothetical protein
VVRNDGVDARFARIHQVVEWITGALNKAKQEGVNWIPLKKTFAEIEWNTGLTQQKIIAYASNGVERGIYVLDQKNDQIRLIES